MLLLLLYFIQLSIVILPFNVYKYEIVAIYLQETTF